MKWDISNINEWTVEDFPHAAIIPESGNSDDYNVGGWRSERPYRDDEVCTQCMLCWIFCPDTAVVVKDEKVVDFDLAHCKGCGICANECPTNPKFGKSAIEMVPEGCELPGVK
ncbi:MAG: 4Fe-4S binding protein [Coriobacteriia bacterium]|nr:4Fe-4S binding protein [Coriobacteriia bacterium]